jgi:hypothetical protein
MNHELCRVYWPMCVDVILACFAEDFKYEDAGKYQTLSYYARTLK